MNYGIIDNEKTIDMRSNRHLFHYFESKEALLLELVRLGCSGPASVTDDKNIPPDVYLVEMLRSIFSFAKEQPWVFKMLF